MSLVELSNPYLTAFATGLIYGLVACAPTCVPYLASYIAGTGANFRKSIAATLTFNTGRVIAYTLFGVLFSIFGGLLHYFTDDVALNMLQTYSAVAFSVVTIILGTILLYKNRKATSCNCAPAPFTIKTRYISKIDMGALTLGLTRGLLICPPIITLLVYSATFANPIDSIFFAVLFGIGTALSPVMIFLGGITGWLLNKATLLQKYIAFAGAIIIIILGFSTLFSSLQALV
ncbi:MAG: sulfite exporter TauE/SafE family protein [Nitrososphaerota archaeon]|jgi:thiol:disulfide interchange protein DsbD|nr:sulfite exporter TauE/SafE family protein [Nitrososphaerota archaeon]